MKRAKIKNSIIKMQTAGVNIEESLQTYLAGYPIGIRIPPERIGPKPRDGLGVTKLSTWNNTYVTVNESIWILENAGISPEKRDRGIWYPIPDDLEDEMLNGKNPGRFLSAIREAGWKRRIPNDDEVSSLLGDFLRIADADNSEVEQVVLGFVKRWGPLWYCANHSFRCPGWIPQPHSYEISTDYDENKCIWYRSEPIIMFQAKAKQVEAAIQIAGYIANDQPAPFDLFLILDPSSAYDELIYEDGRTVTIQGKDDESRQLQVHRLLTTINEHLSTSNSPGFVVTWGSKRDSLTTHFELHMAIQYRWGFFPLVWLQLAQNITGSKGIYRCAACDKWHIPTRKPREDKRNYCLSCQTNKSGPKKVWKRDSDRSKREASRNEKTEGSR